MENSIQYTAAQRESYSTRLLELNRVFQHRYANRLKEIMLEQQQRQQNLQQQQWDQQHAMCLATVAAPPLARTSVIEDQGRIGSTSEQLPSAEWKALTQKRHHRVKIRFNPYQLQHRPNHLSAVLAKDPIEVELWHNEKMVRSHSLSSNDRTPQQMEKLERNAYMSRISKAKSRALETLLRTEHEEAPDQNRTQKLLVSQKRVYVNELYHLLGLPRRNLSVYGGCTNP